MKAEKNANTSTQPPSAVVSRPKRRRRKRTKNLYFTKVHEKAIVEYCSTQDLRIRTELYESLIQPAFNEMVDKIIFTYKFNILPNIDFLKDDCDQN